VIRNFQFIAAIKIINVTANLLIQSPKHHGDIEL